MKAIKLRTIMKGIIFDLDGTMVDNMMVHHRAWQKKLASLGLDLDLETVRREIHGVNEEIIARIFGDRFSPEERRRISAEKELEYRTIFRSSLQLVNGLPQLLEAFSEAGIPMAVGTAAPIENVDFVLDGLGIRHYFRAVLHAGHVSRGKPDPEIFRKAVDAMGVKPEECLVFEDSPAGAETALRLGSKAIIVTTTHQREEFRDFSNVVGFIKDYSGLSIERIKEIAGFA